MMGGILTSTILTLLIIPLFYTLFDDLRILFFNRLASIFFWKRKAPQAGAPVPNGEIKYPTNSHL